MAAPYSQFSPSPTPVNICVEAVLESQIQEVRVVEKPDAPDGHDIQEVYAPYVKYLDVTWIRFHKEIWLIVT